MKKILLAVSFLLFAGIAAKAQAPNAFNYQGVARTSTGTPIAGTPISLRLSIHDVSSTGAVVYQETQNVTTNTFGLFNVAVGTGTPTFGTLGGVTWGTGNKYMEVEIDPAGGSSYTSIGASQLLSVPFALVAGNVNPGTVTSVTAGAGLSGGTITSSGTISMPNVGTAGTYGSASTVPVITTDAQGRVTAVTTTTITPTTTWNLTGNAGTNPATNFIGTTDIASLRFRADNLWAGEINTGNANVSFGLRAGMSHTTGYGNTGIGTRALSANTTGSSNTATGDSALSVNTTGFNNTANGWAALYSNTTGANNTAIGNASLNANTTGSLNSAFGNFSLVNNTTGSNNTATGDNSLHNNTTGNWNTADGDSALVYNTTGFSNTAIGLNALAHNTTGVWNTGIGEGVLHNAVNDTENTAIGIEALYSNTTGNYNVASGALALTSNTTGNYNTANGYGASYSNTTGTQNSAFGDVALVNNTIGNQNAAFGLVALRSNTTGNYNAGFGAFALQTDTTGTFNTAIGYAADVSLGNLTNATALGSYAIVNASNKVVIGSTSVTAITGYTSVAILSDGRFKTDIKENVPGLDFINKLKPVTYRFEARKMEQFLGSTESSIEMRKASFDAAEAMIRTGFIAQDVEKAAQETGYNFSGVHKPTNEKDNYGLAYAEFTVPLVKAVQELSAKNEALQKQVADLMKRIETLENKK